MSQYLKDIKGRLEALEKTGSITQALQHISIAKTKKAQRDLTNYVFFKEHLNPMIIDLYNKESNHPIFKGNSSEHTLYILITSDRGLVGPYHQQLFRAVKEELKNSDNYSMIVMGIKGFYFAKKNHYNLVHDSVIINRDFITTFYFKEYSKIIHDRYLKGKIGNIKIIYMNFINTAKQEVKIKQILPIEINEEAKEVNKFVLYETDTKELASYLSLIFLDTNIYGALVDAQSSEHASRLLAMQTATDNVREISRELSKSYHRIRQQAITSELIDVVNGTNF